MTPRIAAGQRYTLKGVSIDIHLIRCGEVCYRIWPKEVHEMRWLDNLYRTDINEFVTRLAKENPTLEIRREKP